MTQADFDYTNALYNGDVNVLKEVFTHFGYEIPQPIPQYPPLDWNYDYYSEWLEPGIIDATENDPTLPTEDEKVQRQEEMWQYANDLEDAAWSPGGSLYEIDAYWSPIINNLWKQKRAKEKEIDERTDKFNKD